MQRALGQARQAPLRSGAADRWRGRRRRPPDVGHGRRSAAARRTLALACVVGRLSDAVGPARVSAAPSLRPRSRRASSHGRRALPTLDRAASRRRRRTAWPASRSATRRFAPSPTGWPAPTRPNAATSTARCRARLPDLDVTFAGHLHDGDPDRHPPGRDGDAPSRRRRCALTMSSDDLVDLVDGRHEVRHRLGQPAGSRSTPACSTWSSSARSSDALRPALVSPSPRSSSAPCCRGRRRRAPASRAPSASPAAVHAAPHSARSGSRSSASWSSSGRSGSPSGAVAACTSQGQSWRRRQSTSHRPQRARAPDTSTPGVRDQQPGQRWARRSPAGAAGPPRAARARVGHAAEHQQTRAADRGGALDVGVEPVADHDRALRRRALHRLAVHRRVGLAGRRRGRPRSRAAARRPATRCPAAGRAATAPSDRGWSRPTARRARIATAPSASCFQSSSGE